MIEYLENGDIAVIDGYKFRRDKKTGYYLSAKPINGKRKRLHIYVWERFNGIIPTGYVIHHTDHDKSNNEIDNLELLTADEHRQRHKDEITEKQLQTWRKNLEEKARVHACLWHGSEKGKEWHKQHYEAMKDKLYISREYECTECGKPFVTTRYFRENENHFCCNNCKSMFRRKSGVDNIERECEICGKTFIANKYSKAKRCEEHKGKGGRGGGIRRCL